MATKGFWHITSNVWEFRNRSLETWVFNIRFVSDTRGQNLQTRVEWTFFVKPAKNSFPPLLINHSFTISITEEKTKLFEVYNITIDRFEGFC